jgi:cyclohexadieny/prephenate dehydrogenase
VSGSNGAVFLVVGCGLIGSSLARAARAFRAAERVLVVEPDDRARAKVVELGLADEVSADVGALAPKADLIAVCTPPRVIVEAALGALAAARPDAVVFDVAGVKSSVVAGIRKGAKPGGAAFVPAHPIAGTERSGPEAGFADLFENRWCIVTPEGAPRQAVDRVARFWETCGARVAAMGAAEHDALLALTSHVPHLVAYALTATARAEQGGVDGDVVRYSAGGFRDFTRIAASDPVMWRDIFLENRTAVLAALDRFEDRLRELRREVEAGDGAGMQALFASTRAVRAAIVAEGQETAAPDFGRPHHGAEPAGEDG